MSPDPASVADCIFQVSQDAVSSPMGNEVALLDFRTNTYFTLNETGASIWVHLAEPRSVDALCQHVAGLYEIDPRDCRNDVLVLLAELKAAGLIDAVDGARH